MKRRGLSTIVGAVFFVLVMGTTIGYVTYSMDLLENLAYNVDAKQDTNLNRQNEAFEITAVSIDNNEFNLTVTNTGNLPINITRMFVKNMTDSTWNQTKHEIKKLIPPGVSVSKIGEGVGLSALDSESYDLKLVTERGNSLNTQMLSASGQPLEMILYTSPANPLTGQNVTLLYSVKNNLTKGSIIHTLVPDFRPPITTGSATAQLKGSVMPASVEGLKPGESAFFKAIYYVEGGNTEKITFNATIAGATAGNFVSDTTVIDIPPVSESAINEILGGQVGIIAMNFTSFEACIPGGPVNQDCRSNSSDWTRAWNLTRSESYLFRLNFTNNGAFPIIIEKATHLLGINVKTGGGANPPAPFFIRADSNILLEDPGAYVDLTKTLPANPDIQTPFYFGSKNPGEGAIQKTDTNAQIVSVFVILFGYEDSDGISGKTPGDTEYAQTLPFQAYRLHD